MSPKGLTCAQAQELAPELALGALDGVDRAAVLSHLAGCPRCRDLADQLAGVVDGLLLLAPGADPPPGLQARVLERIATAGEAERPSARRRSRRGLLGIAAVALVAALAGGGLALVAGPERAAGEVHTALARDDRGRWTCRAVAYGTDPAWLFVALDRRDGANRSYAVEARRIGDPTPIHLGELTLREGHGSLATRLQVPAPELHSIRMFDDTGRLRYEAEFRPSR